MTTTYDRYALMSQLNDIIHRLSNSAGCVPSNTLLIQLHGNGTAKHHESVQVVSRKAKKAGTTYAATYGFVGAPISIIQGFYQGLSIDWDFPKLVKILKQNHKIGQYGAGKGKGLLLFNWRVFTDIEEIKGLDELCSPSIPKNATVDDLRREIEALSAKRAEDQKTIAKLKSDLVSQSQSTWG